MFYIWLSLSSHLWYWFLLSLFSHQTQLPSTEKEQNDTPIESEEKQIIFMGKATLIGSSPSSSLSEGQAARPRPLWSDHRNRHRRQRRKRHGQGHSNHHHRHCRRHHYRHCRSSSPLSSLLWSRRSLSLFFGGWLFWLLVVGWFWLMVDRAVGVRFGMGMRFWLMAFFFWCRGWYWL